MRELLRRAGALNKISQSSAPRELSVLRNPDVLFETTYAPSMFDDRLSIIVERFGHRLYDLLNFYDLTSQLTETGFVNAPE